MAISGILIINTLLELKLGRDYSLIDVPYFLGE